jgi:hypothetical protein
MDPFDPNLLFAAAPSPHAFLHLSNRIDCYCILDHEDYEWARRFLWCHSYGSGSYDEETRTIDRPDVIYARRSVAIPGRRTPSGRQAYGNLWLHRAILTQAQGPAPYPDMVGDHINGDTLDNRRTNLRWATRVQNSRNVKGSAERARLIAEQNCLIPQHCHTETLLLP